VQTGGSVQFTVTSNDIQPGEQLKLMDVTAGNSEVASQSLSPLIVYLTLSSSGPKQYAADQLGKQSDAFTVNWVAAVLSLTTSTSQTTTAGRTSTFTATAVETGGTVQGVLVTFTVSPASGSAVQACQETTGGTGQAVCSYIWPRPGIFTVTATGTGPAGPLTAPETLTFTVGQTPTLALTAQVNGQAVSSGVTVLVSNVLAVLSD
jgi:hypothetical protein